MADALQRARNPRRSDPAAHRAAAQIDAATLRVLERLYGADAEVDARRDLRPAQLTNHYVGYYHYAAPFERSVLREAWAKCAGSRCAEALRAAEERVGPLEVDLPPPTDLEEVPQAH
jgi:hypothetical protein